MLLVKNGLGLDNFLDKLIVKAERTAALQR